MIGLERLARHVLHDDEEDAVLLLGGRHADDVGMVQRREQARLAQQLTEIEILFVRDLDGDALVDPRVFGEVDRAEAATADGLEQPVLAERLAAKDHDRRKYIDLVHNLRVHRVHAPGARPPSVVVTGDAFHHVTHVLRLSAGDDVVGV